MDNNKSTCRVCGKLAAPLFSGTLLTHVVSYFECQACRFVQTETPYWLDEAYADAINDSDTGLLSRNIKNIPRVIAALKAIGGPSGCVVDYAGGYGVLVRLLRDNGIDARWSDPFCRNLFARGFEYDKTIGEDVRLVTAFEAFEHFLNPIVELEKMLSIGKNLFISTQLIADPAPPHGQWWYYGKEHGQHISFYRVETLEYLADRHGLFLTTDSRSMHFLTEKPLSRLMLGSCFKTRRLLAYIQRKTNKSLTNQDHEKNARVA